MSEKTERSLVTFGSIGICMGGILAYGKYGTNLYHLILLQLMIFFASSPIIYYSYSSDIKTNRYITKLNWFIGIYFLFNIHRFDLLVLPMVTMGIILYYYWKVFLSFSRFPRTKHVLQSENFVRWVIGTSLTVAYFFTQYFNLIVLFDLLFIIVMGIYIYFMERSKILRISQHEQKLLVFASLIMFIPFSLSFSIFSVLLGHLKANALLFLVAVPIALMIILAKRTSREINSVFLLGKVLGLNVSINCYYLFLCKIAGLSLQQILYTSIFFLLILISMQFIRIVTSERDDRLIMDRHYLTGEEIILSIIDRLHQDIRCCLGSTASFRFEVNDDTHQLFQIQEGNSQSLKQSIKSRLYNNVQGTLQCETVTTRQADQLFDIIDEFTNTLSKLLDLIKPTHFVIDKKMLEQNENYVRELANYIHDDVLQDILGVSQLIEMIHTEDNEIKDLAITTMNRLGNQFRQKMFEIYPPNFHEQGLLENIEQLGDYWNRKQNFATIFVQSQTEIRVPKEFTFTIYRTVQEIIQNAIKHSQANRIDVKVNQNPTALKIIVEDDGVGLEQTVKTDDGYGIISIRRDLSLIGGELEINGQRQIGTQVSIVVPLLNEVEL